MANDAFGGLFTTPEEIKQARMDKITAAEDALLGGSLLNQVAAAGTLAGRKIGERMGSMFGLQTAAEQQAAKVQDVVSGVQWDDMKSVGEAAKILNGMGNIKGSLAVLGKGQEIAKQDMAFKTAQQTFDVNKLQLDKLTAEADAMPEFKKVLTDNNLDLYKKEDRPAILRAAAKVSPDNAIKYAELFGAQDKVNVDLERLKQGSFATGRTEIVQDSEGNNFVMTSVTDKKDGSTKVNTIPMGNSPAEPVLYEGDKLRVTEEFGLTSGQTVEYKAGVKGAETKAVEDTKFKTTFVNETFPKLEAAYTTALGTIDEVTTAMDEIDALPEADKKRAYAVMFGPTAVEDPDGAYARLSAIISPKGAEAVTQLMQLTGETYVAAYQDLKGAGQITEYEGKTAAAAKNRLTNRKFLTPETARKALQDYRTATDSVLERNRKRANGFQGDPKVQEQQLIQNLTTLVDQLSKM